MKKVILSLVMLVLVLGMENAQAFIVQRQCGVEYAPGIDRPLSIGDYLATSDNLGDCMNQGGAQRNLANSLYRVCRGRPDSYIVGGTITIRDYYYKKFGEFLVTVPMRSGPYQSFTFETACQFHRVRR